MDIRELLRRYCAGQSNRAIHRDLNISRHTAAKYRAWAKEHNLLTGDLPSLEALQHLLETTLPQLPIPQNISSVEPYRDLVARWRQENVEIATRYMKPVAIGT